MKDNNTAMTPWRGLWTVILAGLMMASTSFGTPSLGTDNFDTPVDTSGWVGVGTDGQYEFTTPHPMSGGNDNGYIELLFPAYATPSTQTGYFSNSDANHTGDYSTVSVSFDFKVDPVVNEAVGLSVYFVSGGNLWTKQFVVPANQWSPVSVSFSGAGWETLTGVDFMSDVMAVQEIGVRVMHFNNDSQWTYGLDNWTVSVPEPETYALILVTLLSLGITFRGAMVGFFRRRRLVGAPTA
jgi:hypothetical protein